MTYKEEVRGFIHSYGADWKKLDKTSVLDPICQRLGQSARGTREQIIKRIESAIKMTHEEMVELARGNIERHLGDVAAEYESEEAAADAIYDEAYTLGFDALADAGIDHATARLIADEVARCFAQP